MADPQTIRRIAERNVDLLTMKAGRGKGTRLTTARIEDGLRCVIEEGPWKLAADMPVKVGGEESAPTPGVLGRGALASCLAICIKGWAARLEVPIDAVEVAVEADFDARGELGMDEDIRPGYQEVRCRISVESPAPEGVLTELIDTAERYSPYVDVFSRAQTMKRILRVNGREV